MSTTVRTIALIMMLAAVLILIFTQWTPILALIPVGAAMVVWNGEYFSTSTRPRPRKDRDRLYE